jgi:putative ABC transport system permease protein
MALRNILRWPVRAALTVLGLGLSVAILVGTLFAPDSIDLMVDATFFQGHRPDASLIFNDILPARALEEARRLPGVLAAEPARTVPVRLSNGVREKRVGLTGKPPDGEWSRVIDAELRPVVLPEDGLAISASLARQLDVRTGDRIRGEVLTGRRQILELPVTAIVEQFFGIGAYMRLDRLNEAMGDGRVIDSVHLAIDPQQLGAFYAAVKETPALAGAALQARAVAMFRETMARNILTMTVIYTVLAGVVGFGVTYNSVRIRLSERARELASLRVLGFTRAEVAVILFLELGLLGLLAIPAGLILGHGLAWMVTSGLQGDLYRVPLVVDRATYAWATLVFLAVTVVSCLIVLGRVNQLDMIEVLKTRE